MPSNFLQVLPDPLHLITDAGFEGTGGTAGQGFASISFAEQHDVEIDKSISGVVLRRTTNQFKWLISLRYNPMTKAQFSPIYNFLMQKKGSYKSFYVSLPQYLVSRNSAFAAYVLGGYVRTYAAYTAGGHSMEVYDSGTWGTSDWTAIPSAGDLFTLQDTDSLHTKAYMVTQVETPGLYKDALSSGNNIRIHFSPGLQKNTNSGVDLTFDTPLIKVTQVGDVQEYSLDSDNLYSFSLKLQETFY